MQNSEWPVLITKVEPDGFRIQARRFGFDLSHSM